MIAPVPGANLIPLRAGSDFIFFESRAQGDFSFAIEGGRGVMTRLRDTRSNYWPRYYVIARAQRDGVAAEAAARRAAQEGGRS